MVSSFIVDGMSFIDRKNSSGRKRRLMLRLMMLYECFNFVLRDA